MHNMFNGSVASGYIIELAHLRTLLPNLDSKFAFNLLGHTVQGAPLTSCLVKGIPDICNKNQAAPRNKNSSVGLVFLCVQESRLMRKTESPPRSLSSVHK